MKKNRGKLTAYLINSLFLAGILLALFTEKSLLLVFWALPFVLFDRSFIIPLVLLMPLLEGALNLEADAPSETILIVSYFPILLFDLYNKKNTKVPVIYKRIFYLFFVMILMGTIVALLSIVANIPVSSIILDNVQISLKLIFFFVFLYFLVAKKLDFVYKGLKHMTFIVPFLLIAIFIYMKFFGVVVGFKEMLSFGNAKHGTYTATLVSIAVYSIWHFFKNDATLTFRIFVIFTMILTLWIILLTGSRNGFLSFFVMITVSIYFYIGLRIKFRNFIIVMLLLVPVTYFVLNNLESATIQRFQNIILTDKGIEGQGVQRIDLWKGAMLGFIDKPITGQGASNQISRAIEIQKVNYDNIAHNTFLEVALQYGIFGIFVYLLMQLQIYRSTQQIDREKLRKHPELSRLMLPFVSYISLFFSSMFVSWIFTSIIWYNICLMFAIIILLPATYRGEDHQQKTIAA